VVSSFLLGVNWGDSRGDDCVDDKKYREIDFRELLRVPDPFLGPFSCSSEGIGLERGAGIVF